MDTKTFRKMNTSEDQEVFSLAVQVLCETRNELKKNGLPFKIKWYCEFSSWKNGYWNHEYWDDPEQGGILYCKRVDNRFSFPLQKLKVSPIVKISCFRNLELKDSCDFRRVWKWILWHEPQLLQECKTFFKRDKLPRDLQKHITRFLDLSDWPISELPMVQKMMTTVRLFQ